MKRGGEKKHVTLAHFFHSSSHTSTPFLFVSHSSQSLITLHSFSSLHHLHILSAFLSWQQVCFFQKLFKLKIRRELTPSLHLFTDSTKGFGNTHRLTNTLSQDKSFRCALSVNNLCDTRSLREASERENGPREGDKVMEER